MVSKQPQNPARKSGLSRFPTPRNHRIILEGRSYKIISTGPAKRYDLARKLLSVCEVVSEEFGYSIAQILGFDRPKELAWARQVAYYVCRWATDASYPHLAEFFANRDHATIIHGVRKVEEQATLGSRDWQRVERIMHGLMGD